MFQRLKEKWKVNTTGLVLVLTTFALGGTACGKFGRMLIEWLEIEGGVIWWILYLLLVTLLWPICVLLVSIPLGQFSFFKNYLHRMGSKMFGKRKKVKSIAIFASGAGSNAQQIINRFRNSEHIKVSLIVCNKEMAGVKFIAEKERIPFLLINKDRFLKGDAYLPELEARNISYIILAGFLWKIPEELIKHFPNKILNIHPALLPKYGGIGMYGHFVHEAVLAAGDKESGITIHVVDEQYDHGQTIFQATCPVDTNETPDSLAQKVHALEHKHFPEVVEKFLLQ